MPRTSIATTVFLMMLAVGVVVLAVLALTHGNGPGVALGAGGVVALVLALMVGSAVKRDLLQVRHAARLLPRLEEPRPQVVTLEFAALQESLAEASARLKEDIEEAGAQRRQLESVLDSMQDAVVAVDAAGRIQWTNQRLLRMLPGSASPSGGMGSVRVGQALVQTIRDPDVLEAVRIAVAEKSTCVRGATSLVPGRKFEVNASPIPGGGAVAVLHDITRIEEVERTQRDFVANVSHELRTPLTSITGYVETLLDHEAGISSQGREFLATILKNATRMNRLTEDLLVMARVEGPSVELHPAPVRSDWLVRDAVKAMQGLVQENQAVLEIGTITETQVFADSDSVMQVLGNLIENAIKYGQPRGGARSRVVISAREVQEPADAVEFSVQDFGQGIASEHLNRIFERFYRVDKTRSRESGGTGLGLAIARHMVQSQGGVIRAESELGQGSRFLFTLPRALYPVATFED